jgi:hypothetical protein
MIKVALLLTLTSLSGLSSPVIKSGEEAKEPPNIKEMVVILEQETAKSPQNEAENVVKEYFKDIPVMISVARCESNFRHTDRDGNILRGLANRQDVGIMQINERFHLEKSTKLEMDIYTLEGNLQFARYLYRKEGVKPWFASKRCWSS